jgi:hypothetical protein
VARNSLTRGSKQTVEFDGWTANRLQMKRGKRQKTLLSKIIGKIPRGPKSLGVKSQYSIVATSLSAAKIPISLKCKHLGLYLSTFRVDEAVSNYDRIGTLQFFHSVEE